MSPQSDQGRQWRAIHKKQVEEWRAQIDELRNLANLENWTPERLEIEIAQRLPADLRIIWDFALEYLTRIKKTGFSQYLAEALREIREYGMIAPGRKMQLLKAIDTAKRKIKYGKRKKG